MGTKCFPLASWVSGQRAKKGKLDPDKINRLDELGFVWNSFEQAWEIQFRELVSYKEEHSDCLVPIGWKNQPLARWVSGQRAKKGKLDPDKINRLDELGFVWDAIKQAWELQFQELVSYKEEHGDCLVPSTWKNNQLATWVGNQRAFRRRDELDADRTTRLNELGFIWNTKNTKPAK